MRRWGHCFGGQRLVVAVADGGSWSRQGEEAPTTQWKVVKRLADPPRINSSDRPESPDHVHIGPSGRIRGGLGASAPPPPRLHASSRRLPPPRARDHIALEAQPQAPFGEQSYSLAFPENLCLNIRVRRCSSYPRLNGVDRRGCSYTSRTLPNAMAHRTSSRCKWRYAKFCFAAVRIPCQLKLVEESLQNESGGVIPGSYRVTRGAVYVCTAVLLFRINS